MNTSKLASNSLYRVISAWEKWRPEVTGPNTAKTQAYALWQWYRSLKVGETFTIDKVTEAHVNPFVNSATEQVSRSTRNMRLAALRSLYIYAFEHLILVADKHRNPVGKLMKIRMRGVRHGLKENKRRQPVTEKQYNLLMEDAEGFMRYAIALGYWTGMRLSDIACLEWASYDEAEGTLAVWTMKRDTRIELDLTDDLYGGGFIVRLLAEVRSFNKNPVYIFPQEREVIMDEKRRANLSVYFGRHFQRCEVIGRSFHCLRHSFASRLQAAGVSIDDVAEDLGHASTKTTEIYTHSTPALAAPVTNIIDEL